MIKHTALTLALEEINLIFDLPYICVHGGVCVEPARALYHRAKRNPAASPPPQKVPASSIHPSIQPCIHPSIHLCSKLYQPKRDILQLKPLHTLLIIWLAFGAREYKPIRGKCHYQTYASSDRAYGAADWIWNDAPVPRQYAHLQTPPETHKRCNRLTLTFHYPIGGIEDHVGVRHLPVRLMSPGERILFLFAEEAA